MPDAMREIMSSNIKHKEQVTVMAEKAKGDKDALAELFEILRLGSDVEKGTVTEVMKYVSQDQPEVMVPYVPVLIEYIDYKAPKVRWGCPESIGHIAKKYPAEVEGAIPKLLGNLEDKSTVVRWCAAFALTEIAKYNKNKQQELVEQIRKLADAEQNNGVKQVYIKALIAISKQ